ncbi:MAG: hypothetical protein UMR38_05500 [Candidatus Izemoplasma sp.]|nr:hypothetical protein [Candidatus Izemoplasma sp.]
MLMKNRIIVGLITGAILGVLCIIGANLRYSNSLSNAYLFAFWYNRLIMGFVIALLPKNKNVVLRLVRGLIIGVLISFMFYSSTDFMDVTGFLAGGVYGIIITLAIDYWDKFKEGEKKNE